MRCEEANSQRQIFRKVENLGAAGTQACKMQIQLVPALFYHNDMDVTLTFRKSELGVVNLSRNLSPNFHPVSFGSEKLQNTSNQPYLLGCAASGYLHILQLFFYVVLGRYL